MIGFDMRIALTLLITVCVATGCRPAAPSSAAAASAGRSPTATLEKLIAIRAAHQYEEMNPLIIAEQRHEVVRYLMAIDEYLTANGQLCRYVRDNIATGLAQTIDQSRLAGNLNIFSQYVTLLDERIDGDRADVSFLVDEKLPARHAQLRRVGGHWLYDPGPGERAKIVPAVQRMAEGLRRVLRELQSGGLDTAAMRDDPKLLIEAVRIRILPGVKMLPDEPADGDDG